jgi:hypothetical protein
MISAICKSARRGQGKYVLSKLMTASSHMTKYGRTLEEASGLDYGVGELDATGAIPTERGFDASHYIRLRALMEISSPRAQVMRSQFSNSRWMGRKKKRLTREEEIPGREVARSPRRPAIDAGAASAGELTDSVLPRRPILHGDAPSGEAPSGREAEVATPI